MLSFQCQQEVEISVTIASVLPQAIIPVFKNESRPLNSMGLQAVPRGILGAKQLIRQWYSGVILLLSDVHCYSLALSEFLRSI